MKSYTGELVKRDVQKISLTSKRKSIFGLGGPDINRYIGVLRDLGYRDITLFENNPKVYEKQKRQKPNCDLIFDNILNHLGHEVFYDFDFCSTMRKIEPYMLQIIRSPQYSLTLSLRGMGYEDTISTFRKYTDAKYISYFDTSAMITFFQSLTKKDNYVKNNNQFLLSKRGERIKENHC